MIKNILNLGDSAVYCDFGPEVNKETNRKVINYFKFLKEKNIDGVLNLTPSYNKLIITFDLDKTSFQKLKDLLITIKIDQSNNSDGKKLEVPICCDEEFSLDIKRLEKKFKLDSQKILQRIFEKEYFCYMTGFIAGMPFFGDLDIDMRCNRLETPRLKVPKGSIGITEQFANIYTEESPGGWNIIGKTPLEVFDRNNQENPALINPGDVIQFKLITKKDFDNYK